MTEILFIVIMSYLTACMPTLGQLAGNCLSHPMLITSFLIFNSRLTEKLVTSLGPKARVSTQ